MRTLFLLFLVPASAAAQQQKSTELWSADLDQMVKGIVAGHKNAYHTISKADFDKEVESLRKRLPDLSDAQRTVEFMRLVTRIGDGHTAVRPDFADFHVFPIDLYSFDDGLFVVAAIDKALIGSRVVSIGGKPIEQVRAKRSRQSFAHDNKQSLRNAFQHYVIIAEFLQGTGIIETAGSTVFELQKDGTTQKHQLKPVLNATLRGQKWHSGEPSENPLYRQKRNLNHWNDWLADSKTLYFKYNRCQDAPGFLKLARGTMGFIQQNDVQRFVLDLRDNPGGNSAIFKPLLWYLQGHEKLNAPDKLYVIIGRRTFSSGLWNAVEMDTKTKATLIGEPTGGRPNHYGEVGRFKLKNSGLTVIFSKKYHKLLADEDPESLMPDIAVPFNAADFFSGRDPYLKAALEHGKR